MALEEHWDRRYREGGTDVSWFEAYPATSLRLLDRLGVTPSASVVDVGGGEARLVDALVERGHRDLAVVDVSRVALDDARARVGEDVPVQWIAADVTQWEPARTWDVWHDRAVLHFLVDDAARDRYAQTMRRAVAPGGAVVIGVFAEDGPTECSSLPVRRHAADDLVALLGSDARVVATKRVDHTTPSGVVQPFNWIAARV